MDIDIVVENQESSILEREPVKLYKIYENDILNAKIKEEYYYDKDIALDIYNNMVNLNNNVSNSFPELMELYSEDINNIYQIIEELKKQDEEKYQEDLRIYRKISNTNIFARIKHEMDELKEENIFLQKKVKEDQKRINSLLKKFSISLDGFEKLKMNNNSIINKFFRKKK